MKKTELIELEEGLEEILRVLNANQASMLPIHTQEAMMEIRKTRQIKSSDLPWVSVSRIAEYMEMKDEDVKKKLEGLQKIGFAHTPFDGNGNDWRIGGSGKFYLQTQKEIKN